MTGGGAFGECSFLWVTNSGAAEITANSIASLKTHLMNSQHSMFVGTLDPQANEQVSAYTDCTDVHFFRVDEDPAWRAQQFDLPREYVNWGREDFRLICKSKYYAIRKVLRQTDQPVIFADGDVVFLKNPAPFFETNPGIDNSKILVQNDRDASLGTDGIDVQLKPGRLPKGSEICAGFTVWRPLNTHLKIAEYIGNKVSAELSDQPIFNSLPLWKRRHVQLLPLDFFPNGSLTFGRPETGKPEISLTEMYIVHANWRLGLDCKIKTLKDHDYWYI